MLVNGPGLEITFGHRTKTEQFTPNPNNKTFVRTLYPDKNYSRAHFNMAWRKRKRTRVQVDHINNDSVGTSDDSAGSSSKKRTVNRKTVEGWISQYDKEFHTMRWLDFSMQGDGKHVAVVRCKVCCEFSERLISLRNYRPTFIEGTDNVRSSAVVDHAKSAMHARAMDLYRIKTQAPSPLEYAPIARAFVRDILDPAAKERLVKKFEIAFFIAKEKLPFTKFFPLCKMEEVAIKMIMPVPPLFVLLHLNNWKY